MPDISLVGFGIMFRKTKIKRKIRILFIDEFNDLQSQIAEYFMKKMHNDVYDVFSAGPKCDCIDCELVSVMYQMGYDIRSMKAKDFNEKKIPCELDYVVFLEKITYDRIKNSIPWDAPKILMDFGRKDNFDKATNDIELAEYYKQFIENVRMWVEKTFTDFEKLKFMVI